MATHRTWTCSICGRHATIGAADESNQVVNLSTPTSRVAEEAFYVLAGLIRCPNPKCHEYHLTVQVLRSSIGHNSLGADSYKPDHQSKVGVGKFQFIPATTAPLSSNVPAAVKADYVEAYLIRSLSPKAAATLARRALQGMIRDFWQVSMSTLHQELLAIKDRCDPDIYQAMMDVKSLGNIGAHPERDVALIIDIDPGEAQQLLDLIHLLDQDWYVQRANRQERLDRLRVLASAKAAEKPSPK